MGCQENMITSELTLLGNWYSFVLTLLFVQRAMVPNSRPALTSIPARWLMQKKHRSSSPNSLVVDTHVLTNDELAVLGEIVFRNLKVQRCRSFSYTAGDIVVGTVAGAKPTAVVARFADGDTTQMGADACFQIINPTFLSCPQKTRSRSTTKCFGR